MTSKQRRVGARQGLSAKKTVAEKLGDLRNGNGPIGGLTKNPTQKPSTNVGQDPGPQSPDRRPEPSPPTSDCGGWGGVSNAHTNHRGGRRGR